MSLATRCSACGTIFRVVEDQLRVSDGWVRCGRCAEVFDARAQLFDIDREAPPQWPANTEPQSPQATEPDIASPHNVAQDSWERQPDPATSPSSDSHGGSFESHLNPNYEAERAPSEPTPSQFFEPDLHAERNPEHHGEAIEPRLAAATASAQVSTKDSRFDSRLEPHWTDETPASTVALPAPAAAGAGPLGKPIEPPAIDMGNAPDVLMDERLAKISAQIPTNAQAEQATASTNEAALPEFLRTQPSKTKWQRPAARIAMGLLSLLLLSTLLLQVGLHFRNSLAALQPKLRPTLQAACALAGCELKAWQRIESVGVESSALNQAGSGNHYQLVVGLRNKTRTEVATPWVDVSLTDSAGALVAKRILSPADFKTDKQAMEAGSDLVLQTMLSTGDKRVSGYSVEIFYP